MKTRLSAVVLTMACTVGLAVAADSVPTSAQFSGFLGDYSALQPATDREGTLLYLDKSADYKGYTKIMFDPVEVYLTPNPEYKGMQPDALKRMTDGFLKSFRKALEPDYQIVTAPGSDVLRVKAAITGVQVVKPPLGVTDFIPIKAVFNLGRKAAGADPYVAEMTAEMEVLDPNDHRVAAAVVSRKGNKTLTQNAEVTWKEMESITDYWASGMRQRLDEVRGVAPKK